jgi:hypothetical protein
MVDFSHAKTHTDLDNVLGRGADLSIELGKAGKQELDSTPRRCHYLKPRPHTITVCQNS